MNPLKINELLKMILSKVPMKTLLPVRAVCRHWNLMIEAIFAQKRCLKLYCSWAHSNRPVQKDIVTLSNRFVGTIKPEQFVKLKPKWIKQTSNYENPLKADFCAFLGKIFPRVEQLIVDLNLDAHSATNLQNTIEKCWQNLNTLSLSNGSSYHLGTTFRINKQLKRLDLSESLRVVPNAEMFAQLEHFSCANSDENNLDKLPPLGPNCTSFCWGFALNASKHVAPIGRWIRHQSVQVLSNITHLGLFWVNDDSDNKLISLICSNFPALQALSVRYYYKVVFNSATFVQLKKLSHLNTLCLGCIKFDLNSLDSRTIQLSSIRVLNLVHFHFDAILPTRSQKSDFDGDRFCRVFASIMPNIGKLGIFSSFEAVHARFRDNLRHFSKFLQFKILKSTFDSYVY